MTEQARNSIVFQHHLSRYQKIPLQSHQPHRHQQTNQIHNHPHSRITTHHHDSAHNVDHQVSQMECHHVHAAQHPLTKINPQLVTHLYSVNMAVHQTAHQLLIDSNKTVTHHQITRHDILLTPQDNQVVHLRQVQVDRVITHLTAQTDIIKAETAIIRDPSHPILLTAKPNTICTVY